MPSWSSDAGLEPRTHPGRVEHARLLHHVARPDAGRLDDELLVGQRPLGEFAGRRSPRRARRSTSDADSVSEATSSALLIDVRRREQARSGDRDGGQVDERRAGDMATTLTNSADPGPHERPQRVDAVALRRADPHDVALVELAARRQFLLPRRPLATTSPCRTSWPRPCGERRGSGASRASGHRASSGRSHRRRARTPSTGCSRSSRYPSIISGQSRFTFLPPWRIRSPAGRPSCPRCGRCTLDLEQVDQLGAPGRVRHPRQLLAVGERVDQRRLADVRPADERHLGRRRGELVGTARRLQERQAQRSTHGINLSDRDARRRPRRRRDHAEMDARRSR